MFSACASAQGADSFHSLYLHISNTEDTEMMRAYEVIAAP
jgi:hypothetical protein